jgi:hypothetical protein
MLDKAKTRLGAAGIQVVDWEPYKSMELLEMTVSIIQVWNDL